MTSGPTWLNPLLWVSALVLINVLWANVAQQEAPNEVNSAGNFATYREVTVAPVLGSEEAIPASFTTLFSSTSLDQANVSYALKLDNSTVITSWSGMLTDASPRWSGELEPGIYTVVTEVEEGVEVEQTLTLTPFAPLQVLGHLSLSVLLVVTAVVEQFIRNTITKRKGNKPAVNTTTTTAPFKPLSHGPEHDEPWEEGASPWRDPLR
jgi:hypothetical protein